MTGKPPPPIASPEPPEPSRHDTKDLPATRGELRSAQAFWRFMLSVGGAIGTLGSIGLAYAAYHAILGDAKAQTTPLEVRVTTIEAQQRRTDDNVFEVQKDVRELYKSWSTGQPSARLEQPLPPKDAGQ